LRKSFTHFSGEVYSPFDFYKSSEKNPKNPEFFAKSMLIDDIYTNSDN